MTKLNRKPLFLILKAAPPNKAQKCWLPTHKMNGGEELDVVRAWRYLKTSPVPLWVFRNFHDLGDGKLTHTTGAYAVTQGDWIVDVGSSIATVLTDPEFTTHFTAL